MNLPCADAQLVCAVQKDARAACKGNYTLTVHIPRADVLPKDDWNKSTFLISEKGGKCRARSLRRAQSARYPGGLRLLDYAILAFTFRSLAVHICKI